ncbi:hypothetical protein HZS_7637 [Henneguya salminicola]|nr:hypothetical protein HZS_7637 [Henneguya salminicola]
MAYLDIVVSAYSPLGSYNTPNTVRGNLTDVQPALMDDPLLKEIALKYNTSVASILLKWGISRGTPVIVRSSNISHIAENIKSDSLIISEEHMNQINELNLTKSYRYFDYRHLCPPGINYIV